MWNSKNLLCICVIHLFLLKTARSNDQTKGWLRICNKEKQSVSSQQRYEVEADKCPHGAWFSEKLDGRCVCLNGLWAISDSWCDEDYLLAYGNNHCFKLDKKIQKLAFLGNPLNPFETVNFVTKENGHVFRSFSSEFLMPYEYSRQTNRTILRLRPGNQSKVLLEVHPETWADFSLHSHYLLEEEDPVCYDTKKSSDWTEDMLLIYKVRSGIKYIKVTKDCPKPLLADSWRTTEHESTTYKMLPGQVIHMKSGKIMKANDNCMTHCLTEDSSLTTLQSHGTLIRHKRSPQETSQDFGPLILDSKLTEAERDEMVNAANLRVMKQELNWLLQGIQPPRLNSPTWKLVRKIRQIFVKACPHEAPQFLTDSLTRMFRLFYLHSKDFYPNSHVLEEYKQYGRISQTLDECLGGAEPMKFLWTHKFDLNNKHKCKSREMYYKDPITGELNETAGTSNITYCPCLREMANVELKYALNLTSAVTFYNLSKSNVSMSDDMTFVLPKESQFNGTLHDLPTETMWKMISFAHYYCAKHFRYQPADHSALITRLETLFNDDILYRWTRPGRNSNKLWQLFFVNSEIKRFTEAVDNCVSVAKYLSEYPEWITRPTPETRRRRKRSLSSETLWNGKAYCLDDPWDPVIKLGEDVPNQCADLGR